MAIEGWYYLHTNGELIHKPDYPECAADIRDSDFAVCMWPIDPSKRSDAWRILVEALSLGAKRERITELANKWKCTDEDAKNYAEYLGMPPLCMDGNQWCAQEPGFINPQESIAGFGDTCLDALADLCKSFGFNGGKMWVRTFHDYCGK